MVDSAKLREWGQNVVKIEIEALQNLYSSINDEAFASACLSILKAKGKVIVMGIGKSGHIGHKIASTFASTGTSSFFVHPSEAAHGDLGMIESQDVALMISNSGESPEILALLPTLQRKGVTIISLTSKSTSTLAKLAHINLPIFVDKEACPLGLAPTASTTATLALGDALAVALLTSKGFTARDFAQSHPGGKLGKKLLLRVEDIMHTHDNLPIVSEQQGISEVLIEMSQKGLGMAAIVNSANELIGVFTDGDLRRSLDAKFDIHQTAVSEVMTRNPHCIKSTALAEQAIHFMQQEDINGLFITDAQQHPIGAIHISDLIKAGLS